jgi:tRNA(fMet)-specific endonuclease VapC
MLDTDIASYAIEEKNEALRLKLKFVSPSTIFISSVTVAEMFFGLKGRPRDHPIIGTVYNFIQLANVLDWDTQAARAYADIRYSLIRSGRTINELDMMIAAHALSSGATLVSNNTRHFRRIVPPLKLENWTEP